jgi:hypothetical protein
VENQINGKVFEPRSSTYNFKEGKGSRRKKLRIMGGRIFQVTMRTKEISVKDKSNVERGEFCGLNSVCYGTCTENFGYPELQTM